MIKANKFSFSAVIEMLLFLFLVTIVMLVLVQVFSRHVSQLPLQGIEELARLVFVWACLLGASLCVVKGIHLKVEIFRTYLPSGVNNWVSLIVQGIVLMVSAVMIITGSQFVISRWIFPDYSTALHYPRSMFWVPVPLSGAIMFVHTVKEIIAAVRKIFKFNES